MSAVPNPVDPPLPPGGGPREVPEISAAADRARAQLHEEIERVRRGVEEMLAEQGEPINADLRRELDTIHEDVRRYVKTRVRKSAQDHPRDPQSRRAHRPPRGAPRPPRGGAAGDRVPDPHEHRVLARRAAWRGAGDRRQTGRAREFLTRAWGRGPVPLPLAGFFGWKHRGRPRFALERKTGRRCAGGAPGPALQAPAPALPRRSSRGASNRPRAVSLTQE